MSDDRFRPSRAGIVNLWDYRDEEFVFAEGRLVLRGPNGSGKTKALEVLFPFVLDGRIEPRRLNPFASEDRTMKSNLLYRGQDSAHSYVWLEFSRDGGADAVTVGVGLRAQRHNDRVTRWYFVADGRVGVDFSLLAPDDRPLTRKQLAVEIGADAVTDRAAEHRAAVDARLFGLGTERYEQMLTLVLTLRRPQLAKNLDPKGLSRALSDGLRPLEESLIAEAARSFDDMESVQRTLDGLVQADNAARAFLATYTSYLRTHARAAADVVAVRLGDAERARVALAVALGRRQDALRRRAVADAHAEQGNREVGEARAHLEALHLSKAYESKAELDKLAELVEGLAAGAGEQRQQATRAAGTVQRRTEMLGSARASLADAERAVSRAAAALAAAAADAGMAWDVADSAADAAFGERVAARIEMRRDDAAVVREALSRLATASRDRLQRQGTFDAAVAQVTAAEHRQEQADQALTTARSAVAAELSRWAGRHQATLGELGASGVLDLLPAALLRVGEPDAPGLAAIFGTAVRDPVQHRRDALGNLRGSRSAADADLAVLRDERDGVAAERDDAPPAFGARMAERAQRAGAPLWRLVRFVDDLPTRRSAAVEAALEAANLLDAWVHPDDQHSARAVRAGDSDAYLVPLPAGRRPSGPTLADVLTPEPDSPDSPVSTARVAAVLRSVALAEPDGDLPAVPTVSDTGAFAQGIQIGVHGKAQPEYIGATARQRRRQARLADLDQRIGAARATVGGLDREIASVVALLDSVTSAERELPATGVVTRALRTLADAAAELRVHRAALTGARAHLDQAVAEVGDRERSLVRVAAERSLGPDQDSVDLVAAAVGRFDRAGAALTGLRATEHGASQRLADAERELAGASGEAERLAGEAHRSEARHGEQAEALQTLHAAVGEDVQRLLAQVEEARTRIEAGEKVIRIAGETQRDAVAEAAASEQAVTGASGSLATAIAEAHHDARRLAPYAHGELLGLLRVTADITWPAAEGDWRPPAELVEQAGRDLAVDPSAGLAAVPEAVARLQQAIVAATADLRPSEASLKSSKTRVSIALGELQGQLSAAGHDYRPEWEPDDDVILVRVADEHGFAPVGEFAHRIATARRDQELLLTESERRVLEDALLGRLAQQIHERTIDARDLIGRMGTEMRSRRMSSGAGVGVRWELADGLDEEQRGVCRLLERDASRLGPDELSRLRAHFARQIKTARSQHPDRTYAELLSEVLDYRQWRVFGFSLIAGDGGEERLTQARHSTLSGGEQSVSLHLPLFAAAHVMLSSGARSCPRLLGLDEAFAGVDDTGRRELLGLTAQFDLDLFMTGYDLWATYDTVPACAHYDLSHSVAEQTVSALLLVWDGKQVLADSAMDDLATALGSPGTRRRPEDTDQGMLGGDDGTEGSSGGEGSGGLDDEDSTERSEAGG